MQTNSFKPLFEILVLLNLILAAVAFLIFLYTLQSEWFVRVVANLWVAFMVKALDRSLKDGN